MVTPSVSAGDELVRVFLVDDHRTMLTTLCKLIDRQRDLTVIGVASSAEEALERLETATPDVLLVDLSLPGMSGTGLIERLRESRPDLRALVVSGHERSVYAASAARAGAYGYVTKDDPSGIVEATRTVARGERYR